jgi:circadian clock protein KaiB
MSPQPFFKLRLYIAGDADNSSQAISNLNFLCQSRLAGRHEIEVVDVFREPKRALSDGILMTPTLLKISPAPLRRIVGTLSQHHIVLSALGLEQQAA